MHGDDLPGLPTEPRIGSRWRHRKGGVYEVMLIAREEATLKPVVVYVSTDQHDCCRCGNTLADGRKLRRGYVGVETVAGYSCPICAGRGVWRGGVHFEHEKRCVSDDCDVTWEPEKWGQFFGRCPDCKGTGVVTQAGGKAWTRPHAEFTDGRFALVSVVSERDALLAVLYDLAAPACGRRLAGLAPGSRPPGEDTGA